MVIVSTRTPPSPATLRQWNCVWSTKY